MSASVKQTVKVTILGEDYTIRTATTLEDAQQVATQVDQSIRDIMQSGAVVESYKAAILASLRMAGELREAQAQLAALTDGIRALGQEIRPWLPPAKRHD